SLSRAARRLRGRGIDPALDQREQRSLWNPIFLIRRPRSKLTGNLRLNKMEKPEAVRRQIGKIMEFGERVIVEFSFSADFRSSLQLTASFQLEADKTKSIRDIERMADKLFAEMLQATLLKCQDGIISN
ncbi:MAG TPA: hypothetical protein VF703_18115, partial [Pyrinomonadaceae bacterium]